MRDRYRESKHPHENDQEILEITSLFGAVEDAEIAFRQSESRENAESVILRAEEFAIFHREYSGSLHCSVVRANNLALFQILNRWTLQVIDIRNAAANYLLTSLRQTMASDGARNVEIERAAVEWMSRRWMSKMTPISGKFPHNVVTELIEENDWARFDHAIKDEGSLPMEMWLDHRRRKQTERRGNKPFSIGNNSYGLGWPLGEED